MVTLFLALLGILSPVHRGALLQSCLLLFTFMGWDTQLQSFNIASQMLKNGLKWPN